MPLRDAIHPAAEQMAMDLLLERYGDPHVGFVVLVSADAPPVVVTLTTRGAHNVSGLKSTTAQESEEAHQTKGAFFSAEELHEAARALDAVSFVLRVYRPARDGEPPKLTLGAEMTETIRERWERSRNYPIQQALEQSAYLAEHSHLCECKRRFKTERGLAMHRRACWKHRPTTESVR